MFYQKKLAFSTVFAFQRLEAVPGFVHAFSIRRPGPARAAADPLEEVAGSRGGLPGELGLETRQLLLMEQIHSDRVLMAPAERGGDEPRVVGPGDGVVTVERAQFPLVRTADCVPLLLVLPRAGRLAALHAGWRGTLARIAAVGARALLEATGARPGELIAALGPCIGVCCYQVGGEVRAAYDAAGHDLKRIFHGDHLDLVEANRAQLQEMGVTGVLDSGMCTACRTDLFYSYRREGETGRNWTLGGFLAAPRAGPQSSRVERISSRMRAR